MVWSLIGLFAFRSNPVSKVYQHRSRNDGILEVTWSTGSLRERTVKDTAVWELTPDPFPQLANGTGPNRTRAQRKFTSASGESQRNNQIKVTHYDDPKKRAHDSQIVRAKENLKLYCDGPSQRQASGTNQRIKALRQGCH